MATPIVIKAATDEEFRAGIAKEAFTASHFLLATLARERELAGDAAEGFDHLWRTLYGRVAALNAAGLRALDGDEKVEELANIVYGEWIYLAEEADHV